MTDKMGSGRARLAGALCLLLMTSAAMPAAAQDGGAPWTPRTSSEMRYLINLEGGFTAPSRDQVRISPDGRYVVYISRHSNVDADEGIYTLAVQDLQLAEKAMRKAPDPRASVRPVIEHVAKLRSSYQAPIHDPRWREDSRAIYFMGADKDGKNQLFEMAVPSGAVRQITSATDNVVSYEASGPNLYFWTYTAPEPKPSYPIEWARFTNDGKLDPPGFVQGDDYRYFASHAGAPAIELPRGLKIEALARSRAAAIVDIGEPAYNTLPAGSLPAGEPVKRCAVFLADLRSGKLQFLHWGTAVSASCSGVNAVWSPGDTRVVVSGIESDGEGGAPKQGAVIHDLERGTAMFAFGHDECKPRPKCIPVFGWKDEDMLFVDERTNDKPVLTLVSVAGGQAVTVPNRAKWTPPEAAKPRVTVSVAQDFATPQRVVASMGGRSAYLDAPDPVLARAKISPIRQFRWKNGAGVEMIAGLTLPAGITPGAKTPLVIQNYYYQPEYFLPDGPHPGTGEAAQALAARGIAVLQINAWKCGGGKGATSSRETGCEGAPFVALIDELVDALRTQNVLEATRIGLFGFSHGGHETYYYLTHPDRAPIAAAMIDDSFSADYPTYLQMAAISGKTLMDGTFGDLGGTDFWKNKAAWLEQETSTNVDRVTAPVLFAQHNSNDEPLSANLYSENSKFNLAPFIVNKKPVEQIFLPGAAHNTLRPSEQVALMGVTVDWMTYWLKGEIDPDPAKADRYVRWARLRKQQEAVIAGFAAKGRALVPLPPLAPPSVQ